MTALLHTEPLCWRAHAHVDKWDQDQTDWVTFEVLRTMSERQARVLLREDLASPLSATFGLFKVRPFDVVDRESNLLVTAGLTRITSLIQAAGGQGVTATATRLGVGNGVGTAAIGDTDLSAAAGAANRQFYVMDATFPTASAGVMTFKSTYASADANFAWNEWALDIGTPTVVNGTTVNATLINHKTSAALGTKTTGSWGLTVTITLS